MTSPSTPPMTAGASAAPSRTAALLRSAALALAFACTTIALATPIGFAYLAYERWVAGQTLQEATLHLEDALLYLHGAVALLALAAALAWVVLFLRWFDRQGTLSAVGFTPGPHGWRRFGAAFLGGMLFAAIPVVLALALGDLSVDTSHWVLEGGGDVVIDVVGSVVILAGTILAEELVFRGYILWTLGRSGWTEALTVLLSALLFAAYRLLLGPSSWVAFLIVVTGSVLLGQITRLTRSLHASIGARLGWALVVGTVFSLPVGGSSVEGILHSTLAPGLALDSAFGAESSWVVLVLLAIGVGVAVLSTPRQRGRPVG